MLEPYIKLIKKGEVVAFPTETVYGLGADAWNPEAVRKVFTTKGRPADNPLIVHISSEGMMADFTDLRSKDIQKLIQTFWPGPLTLIVPKKPEVLDIVTAGLPTVAVRWPRNQLAQELIHETGPLVAPSANTSGRPSPTRSSHVKEDFGENFPVIEGGVTQIGLESTVLDLSSSPYTVFRPGAIGAGELAEILGDKVTSVPATESSSAKSPGTKYTHYAPEARVRWMDHDEDYNSPQTLYLLHSTSISASQPNIICYNQNYRRMARELYDRFRQADHEQYTNIAIEALPTDSSVKWIPALQNRIQKALSA